MVRRGGRWVSSSFLKLVEALVVFGLLQSVDLGHEVVDMVEESLGSVVVGVLFSYGAKAHC